MKESWGNYRRITNKRSKTRNREKRI